MKRGSVEALDLQDVEHLARPLHGQGIFGLQITFGCFRLYHLDVGHAASLV